MSVSEEIIKKVSKSESREISLEDLSYCMPKVIAEEALKRIGATQGKFGIDELFIWVSRTFQQHREGLSYHSKILTVSCGICIRPLMSLSWRYLHSLGSSY
ncbi:uncharacterized protein LOC131325942 isoform X1 [Rhododendron vialii]|uniref:uncharacterized protein LOC131325942 isoform X1 n=1 Tax=Rhododendron vialii TaxID=182163 RepID=UPI00265F81D4|nr:uncharacterized protein LOC131325942 isoform X1 [Rhododendron vialii]